MFLVPEVFLIEVNKNFDVNRINTSWEIPFFRNQIYLWVECKCELAGTEEMNTVIQIVEKRLDYIYF